MKTVREFVREYTAVCKLHKPKLELDGPYIRLFSRDNSSQCFCPFTFLAYYKTGKYVNAREYKDVLPSLEMTVSLASKITKAADKDGAETDGKETAHSRLRKSLISAIKS